MLKNVRIGMGFDIHRTKMGVQLILGGCEIPCEFGLVSSTDGDVVLHAVLDALLACAGGPDIGTLFPVQRAEELGRESSKLLGSALAGKELAGLEIHSVDVTILAEKPMLSPHFPRIRRSLSDLLQIGEDSIGIKARTFEGMGEVGRGEAIAAYALVLCSIKSKKSKHPGAVRKSRRIRAIARIAVEGETASAYKVYVDGASRGNPGVSACGCVILSPKGDQIGSKVTELGVRTNNEAEYEAVLLGLGLVAEVIGQGKQTVVHTDSSLVFNQLTGTYRIKDKKLESLHQSVAKALADLTFVSFKLVPREENELADRLVRDRLNLRG